MLLHPDAAAILATFSYVCWLHSRFLGSGSLMLTPKSQQKSSATSSPYFSVVRRMWSGLSLRVVEVRDKPLRNVVGEGAHSAGADVDYVEAHFLHDLARLLQVHLAECKRRACHSDRHFPTSKNWVSCRMRRLYPTALRPSTRYLSPSPVLRERRTEAALSPSPVLGEG